MPASAVTPPPSFGAIGLFGTHAVLTQLRAGILRQLRRFTTLLVIDDIDPRMLVGDEPIDVDCLQ